jgi:hypothetical protein
MMGLLKWAILGFLLIIFLLQLELYLAEHHPCYLVFGIPAALVLFMFFPLWFGYWRWAIPVVVFGLLFLGAGYGGVSHITGQCFGGLTDPGGILQKYACSRSYLAIICKLGKMLAAGAKEDTRPFIECRVRAAQRQRPNVCQSIAGCGTPDWSGGSEWLQCVKNNTPFESEAELAQCVAQEMGSGIARLPKDIAVGTARVICEAVGGIYRLLPDAWQNPDMVRRLARCAAPPGIAACGG